MTNHARAERLDLCATLLRVGPDAPTLCEGWRTSDLAAHLVIRERRPDAQLGQLVPRFARHATALQRALASQPFAELVDAVRSGPPSWHPTRLGAVDELVNTAEFFVHHEDALRAQPSWAARPLPDDEQRALWRACSVVGRLALRKAAVGVELVAPGYGRTAVRAGDPVVRVEGPPGELLLFAFGRRDVAQVHLDGADAAVQSLRTTPSAL
ncbi:MAG: TIGR03085 family metal-binding protein [Actinomycetota bacterium]